jgi:hypothetical protein
MSLRHCRQRQQRHGGSDLAQRRRNDMSKRNPPELGMRECCACAVCSMKLLGVKWGC